MSNAHLNSMLPYTPADHPSNHYVPGVPFKNYAHLTFFFRMRQSIPN